jgi:ABC-2 type transport system permease protein
MPSSHVFEGMRAVLRDGIFLWDHFNAALALNGAYLAVGLGLYAWAFHAARWRGLLLQVGE